MTIKPDNTLKMVDDTAENLLVLNNLLRLRYRVLVQPNICGASLTHFSPPSRSDMAPVAVDPA